MDTLEWVFVTLVSSSHPKLKTHQPLQSSDCFQTEQAALHVTELYT